MTDAKLTPELLNCVIILGERMLVSGAEVHRVEASLQRLCCAYGAVRADVYTTTSNMIVTAETPEGQFLTQTRRMAAGGTDIAKLHELNDLARRASAVPMEPAALRQELERIEQTRNYPRWLRILSYAGIAGAFTLFFGCRDWREVLISLTVGGIVGCVAQLTERMALNKALDRFICAFLASVLAFAALRLGLAESADQIIIGNIMTLIPGIGLTNALRDLFTGDVITGILRSIEAVLLAFAIAAGYVIAVFLLGGGV